mmetsp:Transcript_32315/g.55904  ORF Transcript_32315/g.55904 Transcript_32315/m.55904 type:complete len:395 (+) Transcript_32315:38-1222(+)
MDSSPLDFYSPNYASARKAFKREVKGFRHSGLNLISSQYLLPVRGPQHELLAIDFLKVSIDNDYSRALIVTSGINGLELFYGSAVQCKLLRCLSTRQVTLPSDLAVYIVHAINPFGASWLRRANINNVDLDSNFIANFDQVLQNENSYHSEAVFKQFPTLFNPKAKRRWVDMPRLDIALLILKYGLSKARAVITSGQRYQREFLFFGGKQPEPEVLAMVKHMQKDLFPIGHTVRKVVHWDLRTGYGSFGRLNFSTSNTLITSLLKPVVKASWLHHKRRNQGSMLEGLPTLLKGVQLVKWDKLELTIGTEQWINLVIALRAENEFHFSNLWIEFLYNHESPDDHPKIDYYIQHSTKANLKSVYFPDDKPWKAVGLKAAKPALLALIKYLSQTPKL